MTVEAECLQYGAVWLYLNHVFLLIFTFELAIRMKRSGCWAFFASPDEWAWNWVDFFIVLGGVIDQWMMPVHAFVLYMLGYTQPQTRSRSLGQVMSILRMARLLRILRLVRLIKNIPPLYKLVVGVAKAMQGMAWVMMLTGMVLYICALVRDGADKVLGRGWADRLAVVSSAHSGYMRSDVGS